MKKVLEELFSTVQDFRETVPGIDSQINFSDLNSSAVSAKKMVVNIITAAVYKEIVSGEESDALGYLRSAVGNATKYKENIFDVLKKRKADGGDIYKYELEGMRRQYIDNYYNAMDSLIAELESFESWKKSPYYQLREKLRIQTTEEFDTIYPIDCSYLFFFRTIPLQREILSDTIGAYFAQIEERKADFEDKLKLVLTLMVVALAISRFDIIELPATIRSLFDDSKTSRSGQNEHDRLLSLAASLVNKAKDILKVIDLALDDTGSGNNIITETSFVQPDDKIYLMP